MKLKEYIKQSYASQRQFALANDIAPQQITAMLNHGGYFVIGGDLYIKKRALKPVD